MPETNEQVGKIESPQPQGLPLNIPPQKPKRKRLNLNKIFLSTYFRIGLTFFLLIVLFLTASFIAFRTEQKKKQLEEYEIQVPDAEIIVPTKDTQTYPTREVDQELDPYYGHETDNWKDYDKTNEVVKISIDFPEDWVFTDKSTLTNGNGVKVAEYDPGPVLLKPGQVCDDTLKISAGPVPETPPITSHESISIGNLEGTETIYQSTTFSIIRYCLQEQDKAFVILFYENSPTVSNEKLYNQILSTFQFVE